MSADERPVLKRWISSVWEITLVTIGIGRPGLARRLREASLRRGLKRLRGADLASPRFSWQPLSWIALKIGLLALAASWAYGLRGPAAALLRRAVDFLKLGEALAAKPGAMESLPDAIAGWTVAGLIALASVPIALAALREAFTSVASCPEERVLYAYRGFLLWRRVDAVRTDSIASVSLEQHGLQRALGLGTLTLGLRDGRTLRFRSLWGAAALVSSIDSAAPELYREAGGA